MTDTKSNETYDPHAGVRTRQARRDRLRKIAMESKKLKGTRAERRKQAREFAKDWSKV